VCERAPSGPAIGGVASAIRQTAANRSYRFGIAVISAIGITFSRQICLNGHDFSTVRRNPQWGIGHFMNAEDIALVQRSFAQLSRHTDTLPDLFYSRLFAMNPSLRGMFTGDMADQKRRFLTMLKLVATDLSRPAEWLPMVHELGRGHGRYGVTPQHYDQVAVALLSAIELL
jgi:hemoglobin-like flavoprotein